MFSGTQDTVFSSKEIIDNIDQRELFRKHLGIYPVLGKKYLSPFRKDKTPGCSFKEHLGVLYFVENTKFNGRLYWSIFDIVSHINSCDFKTSLKIISRDYQNIKIVNRDTFYSKRPDFDIRFTFKNWQSNIFDLPNDVLVKEQVYLVDDYWTGKEEMRKNNFHNPKLTTTIAYYFPDTNHVKLYFPEQEEHRFITNCNNDDIYGNFKLDYYQDKDDSHLIITKSQKDRLILDYHMGYNVIAVQTENIILKEEYINLLKQKFKQIYVLFDNDETGHKYSDIYVNLFGLTKLVTELNDSYEMYKTYKTQWNLNLK